MPEARKNIEINAEGLYYRDLNKEIRKAVESGVEEITLTNVAGQRYIGTNLHDAADKRALKKLLINIKGTPGNDLGAFLDGPEIKVFGNVMDGTGNTMNEGRIIAYGRGGDITGFSARGGEIFIRDNVGYRVGIHMKEYKEKRPVLVIGGVTQDFMGEYMAGGVIIVLGRTLSPGEKHEASQVGTGMHGGVIYLRGEISKFQLGNGVGFVEMNDEDEHLLNKYIKEYGDIFNVDTSDIKTSDFTKLLPLSKRPYKQMYAY